LIRAQKDLRTKRRIAMNILIGAISLFALGWILNELTSWPAEWVVAACFGAILGIVIANSKKKIGK